MSLQPLPSFPSQEILEVIKEIHPDVFYELVQKCISLNHSIPEESRTILQNVRLLNSDASLSPAIRTLVFKKINPPNESRSLQYARNPQFWIDYFKEVNAIASFIFQIMQTHSPVNKHTFIHSLSSGPNPDISQIVPNGGLALVFIGGVPHLFFTPFGRYEFSMHLPSTSRGREILEEISARIELTLLFGNSKGTKIFSIRKGFSGRGFPPVLLEQEEHFIDPGQLRRWWWSMKSNIFPPRLLHPVREEMTLQEKVQCYVYNFQLSFSHSLFPHGRGNFITISFPYSPSINYVSWQDGENPQSSISNPEIQPVFDYIIEQVKAGHPDACCQELHRFSEAWKDDLIVRLREPS